MPEVELLERQLKKAEKKFENLNSYEKEAVKYELDKEYSKDKK